VSFWFFPANSDLRQVTDGTCQNKENLVKIFKYFLLIVSAVLIATPALSFAAFPVCQSDSSDIDGDGYGWENNASCVVGEVSAVTSAANGSDGNITQWPHCTSATADPDGDGYGWENSSTCIVDANTTITTNDLVSPTVNEVITINDLGAGQFPICSNTASDPDSDGYGWENNATCVVSNTVTSIEDTPVAAVSVAETPIEVTAVAETVKPLTDAYPYRANGPYAGVLKRCALVAEVDNSCRLNELPFLGLVSFDPTVEDIMNRVVVTHDWMGARFEELLNSSPATLLRMFRSLAVIAIGSDVKPSSYSIVNARLKIDPYYLWMTVAEKRTIDTGDDFRTNFGAGLRFEYFRSFLKPDGNTINFPSLTDDSEREFADIVPAAMSLFFHELAHAVDFTPPWTFTDMDMSTSIYQSIINNSASWLSPTLQSVIPNQSTNLEELAGVRYRNELPLETHTRYRAEDAGALFANDGAVTFYSYSTIREDFANLVQAAMLKFQYDISMGVYFYNKPTVSDPTCVIAWGVMNRIANPSVIPRAEWAVNRAVASGGPIDDFFSSETGIELQSHRVGEDLCARQLKGQLPFYQRTVE